MSNLTTSIQVKLYINPPHVPEFLAAVERIIAFAYSVPEFISFTLYHKPEAPGEFSYIEHWAASKEFVNVS
jgi:quinol monooxygenase YgiN